VAKLAQRNLLRKLGIVDDADDVSQEAIDDFVQLFRQQLPPSAIAALRAMFRMDCERAHAVEEALIRFGGLGAQDLEIQEDAVPAA
jgi:DNA-binding SARP family transcriptional activator